MKRVAIVILVATVLGLGGWMLYDRSRDNGPSSSSSITSDQSNSAPTAKTLDLSNKGLTEVGPNIYDKTDTVVLILSNNKLKSLKSEMGKMTKVEVLKLDHNQLEGSLIAEIRKMPLKQLDASYNNMTGMPAEIGQLNRLQTLNYSYNNITDLPNELANLKNTLKDFNLTGNPLTQETINKLKASLPNTNIII